MTDSNRNLRAILKDTAARRVAELQARLFNDNSTAVATPLEKASDVEHMGFRKHKTPDHERSGASSCCVPRPGKNLPASER